MDLEFIYGLLEIAYAKQNGLDVKSNYFDELKELLPNDWYRIGLEERNIIFDEAVKNKILVSKTESYKNRYPEDAQILGK